MNRLREFRDAAGYENQEAFAAKCHLTAAYLRCLERGKKKPRRLTAVAIADLLGTTAEKLFPDGFAPKPVRPAEYKTRSDDGEGYLPPESAPPARAYPRHDFSVMCWHCRAMLTMRADGSASALGFNIQCPKCGAVFGDIVPLEEAMHV